MLKGRGKTFAPKKVPLRKPGPAPAPTPTTVQPQLQTPEPSQQLQDPAVADEDHASKFLEAPNGSTSTQSGSPASSNSIPSPTSNPQLKRKEREEDVPEPIIKRHVAESDRPVFQASVAPMVEPSDLPANPTTAPVDVSVPDTPKRKDRAPMPSALPTKFVSGVLSPQSTPDVPPRARTEEQREHDTYTQTAIEVPPIAPTAQMHGLISQNTEVADSVSAAPLPSGNVADGPASASNGVEAFSEVVESVPQALGIAAGRVVEQPAVGSGKVKRKAKPKKAVAVQENQAGNNAEGSQAAPNVSQKAPRARRAPVPRKSRKKPAAQDPDAQEPDALEPVKKRRVREETPEDASDQEIDPDVITMGELTKDLKIGKKFSRYAEIKELEEKLKQAAIKARMRKMHPEMAALIPDATASGEPNANLTPGGNATPAAEGDTAAEAREPSLEPPQGLVVAGPRMRLLNGRMVLDDTSLQIDRHANARLEQETMETVEENDFTRKVTSATLQKRTPSQAWDVAANQLFYKGLRQFGTDFEMIASMFPHRNRRQIKLKFNKEEKVNAAKINRILINPKDPIDLEEWEKMADTKLESLEAIHAEREKYDAEQRAEIAKFTDAAAEAMRKKKESIKGSDAARRILEGMSDESEVEGGFVGSNKENGKGKKKAPARKRGRGRNDDPGEIVGMIE